MDNDLERQDTMANTSTDLLEMILRECAGSGAQPWYPSAYAQETGVPRDALDASLDELRLGGLVRLTDWVQGRGQGYALTPEGREVVESPRLLGRLRASGVPPRTAPPVSKQASRADERPTPWEHGEEVRAALLSPATPQVTLTLLFLNILVFVYGCALAARTQVPLMDFIEGRSSPGVMETLNNTGAMSRWNLVVENQWWRLISLCFVHIGLLHLAVNMYSLYVVGPLLERMWGKWRFLLLYLITGLVGSCCMVVFSSGNGAGASGAIWGIMGSMATWVYLNRGHLPRQLVSTWKNQLLIVFVLNVFITYSFPNISAAGHFGGGIAGLVVAVPLHYVRRGQGWLRWLAAAAVAVVPLASVATVEYKIGPEREQQREQQQTKIEQQQARLEQQEARRKYLPEVGRAYDMEKKVFGEYVQPLIFKEGPGRGEDQADPQATKAVAALQKRMKETTTLLASAGPFHDPTAAEAMQAAQHYLEAAGRFYGSFKRLLDGQANWASQEKQSFPRLYTELVARRQQLENLVRWGRPAR